MTVYNLELFKYCACSTWRLSGYSKLCTLLECPTSCIIAQNGLKIIHSVLDGDMHLYDDHNKSYGTSLMLHAVSNVECLSKCSSGEC